MMAIIIFLSMLGSYLMGGLTVYIFLYSTILRVKKGLYDANVHLQQVEKLLSEVQNEHRNH